NSSDRYLLKWLSDPVVIAEYDWASRVAGVVNVLLVQSFQLAFLVVGLRRLDAEDVSLHREIFRHYVVWTGWALLGLAVLSGDAMQLMASVFSVDDSYVGISLLVLLVGIGFWAYGANQIVSSVLTGAGKTGVVAFCVGVAALSNIALNILLIPSFEGVGAAAATAIAFLILTVFSTRFAERLNTVGYDWPLAATTLAVVVALFFVTRVGNEWSVLPRISVRLGILMSYFPILILTRMYRLDELKGGLRTIISIVSGGSRSAEDAPG
ncbi:MAG: polysaccharide biosynthesis C-terminal domain-containing protein, partial [Rhodothermia bacterium]|nr:polysaccharide biosynthesis C-terminal domain-containing protein [Rhodothermia bacterium]